MRRAQLAAARAALAADAFAPFPNAIWLRSLYVDQLVTGLPALAGARATRTRPSRPAPSYPDMPVLVLDGDLDVITPLGDSRARRRACSRTPRSSRSATSAT